MSWQANSWVVERSKHKGSEYLLLLVISNHCDPDGLGCFASVETLARECRFRSARTVRYIIAKLLKSGELVRHENAGPRGCNLYELPFVIRDGFHQRGIRPEKKARTESPVAAKFAASNERFATPGARRRAANFGSGGRQSLKARAAILDDVAAKSASVAARAVADKERRKEVGVEVPPDIKRSTPERAEPLPAPSSPSSSSSLATLALRPPPSPVAQGEEEKKKEQSPAEEVEAGKLREEFPRCPPEMFFLILDMARRAYDRLPAEGRPGRAAFLLDYFCVHARSARRTRADGAGACTGGGEAKDER